MVCAQVMGHDVAIGIAASQGQFELNVYKPLIALDVLGSIRLLADAMASFTQHCVAGIAVNALTPQAAIATPPLVAAGWIDDLLYEPLETMAEAALALCSGDPAVLTGRIAYSLQLLVELQRPVRDLHGGELVAGWQPADIRQVIERQEAHLAEVGWPNAFSFGRVHSPRP